MDGDVVDEPAAESHLRDAVTQLMEPLALVARQQLALAGPQLGQPRVVLVQFLDLALHADELATRVAALLQPVGIDQTQPDVVRLLDDRAEKSFFSGHRSLRPAATGYPPP